jgi:hypothetical protein
LASSTTSNQQQRSSADSPIDQGLDRALDRPFALIMAFDNEEKINRELKRVTLADVVVVTTSETSTSTAGDHPVDPHPHHPTSGLILVDPADNNATADENERLGVCSAELTSESLTFRPNPQSLPLTRRKIYDIAGVRTVLHIQLFVDRTMLTCSQLVEGRVATWLLCKPAISMVPTYERPSARNNSNNNIDLDVVPLLGAAKDSDVVLYTVLAKQIFGALQSAQQEIPILLGLGLPQLVVVPVADPVVVDHRKLFHTVAHLMRSLYMGALEQ